MKNKTKHRVSKGIGLLLFSMFFVTGLCFAQEDTTDYVGKTKPATPPKEEVKKTPKTFEEKLFTGGNFGLSFGTFTFVELSPLIGYRVTDKFQAGVGVVYNLFRDNRYGGGSTSIYGPRIFARYFLFEPLYVTAEYQMLNRDYYDGLRVVKIVVPALPIGLGYRQFIGERAAIDLQVMYDFLYDDVYSINGSPIMIRTGLNINLGR